LFKKNSVKNAILFGDLGSVLDTGEIALAPPSIILSMVAQHLMCTRGTSAAEAIVV